MPSRWLPIALIALLSVRMTVASPPADATIPRQAQKLLEQVASPDGPGVAVLMATRDDVVLRSARGRASIELDVPLSPDHVFRIASVTKIFTAASVLKLAEAGALSLDDALASYLPDFPNAGAITIRQLLNHTAGISDRSRDPQPGFSRRDIDGTIRVAEIARRPLDFAPGTSWRYSNAGYILLGAVIEKVTGHPWHVTLRTQFFDPLGMKHTRYGDNSLVIPGRAAGYTTSSQSRLVSNAGFISMTIPDAAGALVSTVDDLRTWMRALTTGRAIGHGSFRQMLTPAPSVSGAPVGDAYGFGIYLWQIRGARMIGHTGQIPGFASVVGYLPEHDATIIALGNDDTFDARTMGRRLAAIAIGKPYPDVVAVPPTDQELRAIEGTYRFNESTTQSLSARGGKLFAQRGSGNVIPLQMTADKRLHFVPDTLSYFVPVRDAAGRVARLDYYRDGEGPPRPLPRVDPPSR